MLSFAIGLFAVVSPCAIALAVAVVGLPACAEAEPAASAGWSAARPASAVRAAVTMAVSFAAVFAIAGLAVSAGLGWLLDLVPWLAAATGLALAVAGVDTAIGGAGRSRPPIARPVALRAGRRHRLAPAAVFGAVYAAIALPCMLAIFSAIVDQGVVAAGVAAAAAVTLAFGAGCAGALTLLALAAAAVSGGSAQLRAPLGPLVRRAAGALVAGAGVWLVVYWLPALLGGRVERGGAAESAANDLSATVTEAAARYELGFALVLLGISVLGLALVLRPGPH